MLYYLFLYLEKLNFPGARLFHYISFRSAMTMILSLLIALFIGKKIINYLRVKQIGETVRDLGLEGQMQKKGTPTMGGLIILISLVTPILLFCELQNVYVILMLITTLWLGFIGFLDDYIKVFKKDKKGLQGKFKILGKITLGIIVGITFYFSPQVVVREKAPSAALISKTETITNNQGTETKLVTESVNDKKTTTTTIPFIKGHEFNYNKLIRWMGKGSYKWVWIVMVIVIIIKLVGIIRSS